MKIMLALVFTATLILIGGAVDIFSSGSNNYSCCTAAKQCCAAPQVKQADNATFETDPFNILIPGNHF